jgi:hypothetical protein
MRLLEIYSFLLESKSSELQGLGLLKKANVENADEIIAKFASGDESKNQKSVPLMAFVYANGFTDINTILSDFNIFDKLLLKNRVKPMQIVNNQIVIGDNKFNDYISLAEFIHGEEGKYTKKAEVGATEKFESETKKLWSGNGIDIYDGDSIQKCIQYTKGGLTGRNYGFCIGQFGNSMYNSYRDTKDSSFYFIVDTNKFKTTSNGGVDLNDPLHIVVFDSTRYGIELTDADNNTGTISEYGKDVDGYVSYLKSNGVPVDKMVNRPKTDSEKEEEQLLGRSNGDLKWFMKLPFDFKSKYIGRGHRLTDEQFNYLIT